MQDEWTRATVWAELDARHRRRQRSLMTISIVGLWLAIFGLEHYALYELMFLDGAFPTCVQPRQ